MTAVKSDLQKLEALLNSATNARQRRMYQSLLDKARQDIAHQKSTAKRSSRVPGETPGNETSSSQAAESKMDSVTVASSTKKQKRSQPAVEQVLPEANTLDRGTTNGVVQLDRSDRPAETKEVAPKRTKSKSKQPTIFQAVGSIRCAPQIEGDRLFVTIDERRYELKKGNRRWHEQFVRLKQEIAQNGSREMLLRVYPNILHDSKNQEIRYWFTLVRAYFDESRCQNSQEDFIFRGIWNYVPYCSNPVISVNRNVDNLKFYQRLSSSAKKAFIKPQAFPVVWSAPVEPSQYNPELDYHQQMPRYFVQVRAIFTDGQFEVVEMIEEPTSDIPRYIKPRQKNAKERKSSLEKKEES